MGVCFLTTSATARSTPEKGRGVFARAPIARGEVVAAFGGTCVTTDEFVRLPTDRQRHSVQIEDDVFMVGAADTEPADYINHSCEPNCGMSGNVVLIALRDIEVDEELTYDYAMSDGSAYDEFDCRCGAPTCRGRVTGDDWTIEQLQVRYRDHFSPYLARRIAAQAS
jgi:SET domain-containing protein